MPLVALPECLSSKPGGSWQQLQAGITVQLELPPLKGTDTMEAAHSAIASRARRPHLSSLAEASEVLSFDDQLFVKGEALTGHARLPLASPALSYLSGVAGGNCDTGARQCWLPEGTLPQYGHYTVHLLQVVTSASHLLVTAKDKSKAYGEKG